MSGIITAVTDAFSGVWGGIIEALSGVGDLIFVVSEGQLNGLTPFGYVLALAMGLPLATWLFGKAFSWIKGIFKTGK